MSEKITKLIFWVFILSGLKAYSMYGEISKFPSNQIQVFSDHGEIILDIPETIDESLDAMFQDFLNLVNNGEFPEAKKCLKDYCNDLANSLFEGKNIRCSIEDLREILSEFKLKSNQIMDDLNNQQIAIKIASKDTMKFMALLSALCVALTGIYKFDTGPLVVAWVMVMMIFLDARSFCAVGGIVALIMTVNEPHLFFNLVLAISLAFMVFVNKFCNTWKEKSKEFKSIKKIIANFESLLEHQIWHYPGLRQNGLQLKELKF